MSIKEKVLHALTRSDAVRKTFGSIRSVPILGPGVRSIVHAAMPKGTRLWVRIPNGLARGFWMYADPRFELGYTNGDYEPWLQELLRSELRPGACYYDVGAHSGFFCLVAARFAGSSGSVIAIEADPGNAALLKANVARNQLAQVTVVEAAIWSSAGHMTFAQASEDSNHTQGHILRDGCGKEKGITVRAVPLDELVFIGGYRIPDLIKMDIEGAEWEALQGARRVLEELKPKLLCEVHDPDQMGKIRSYLEQFGYVAEEWKPIHAHYADYRQLYLWAVPITDVAREVQVAQMSSCRS